MSSLHAGRLSQHILGDTGYVRNFALVSKGLLSSIEDMSLIEGTFQPYEHSGTIIPIISLHPQECSPSLETYQFSRVLDNSDSV